MPYVYFSVAELELLEDLLKDAKGFHQNIKEYRVMHQKVLQTLGWED